jgi:hypothetical protein
MPCGITAPAGNAGNSVGGNSRTGIGDERTALDTVCTIAGIYAIEKVLEKKTSGCNILSLTNLGHKKEGVIHAKKPLSAPALACATMPHSTAVAVGLMAPRRGSFNHILFVPFAVSFPTLQSHDGGIDGTRALKLNRSRYVRGDFTPVYGDEAEYRCQYSIIYFFFYVFFANCLTSPNCSIIIE